METFVIRIWAPADPEEGSPSRTSICGHLDHVRSGSRHAFRGIDAMESLLLAQLRDGVVAVAGTSPDARRTGAVIGPVDRADGTPEARPRDEQAIEWTEP